MSITHQHGVLRAIATRPAKRAPMTTHMAMMVYAATGLAADAGRKPGKRQVTVVAWEKWCAACAVLGADPVTDMPWTLRRANLLVEGIALDVRQGARLMIGGVVLEVTGETDPCHRMDEQWTGLRAALEPDARGGVRCRIVGGGEVRIGDKVVWETTAAAPVVASQAAAAV